MKNENEKFKSLDSHPLVNWHQSGGFTLIELLVSMSLFLIIVAIAIVGFTRIVRIQRIASEMMAVNDNASFLIEQMAREIRTGNDFCLIATDNIQFTRADGQGVRYKLNSSGYIEKGVIPSAVCSAPPDDAAFQYEKITADNIKVLKFNPIIQYSGVDNRPPLITLPLSFTSIVPQAEQFGKVDIQTTISARCGVASCPADN